MFTEIVGEIPNTCDWYQILESMIQLHLLNLKELGKVYYPYYIERLEIASLKHIQFTNLLKEKNESK